LEIYAFRIAMLISDECLSHIPSPIFWISKWKDIS